MRSLIWPFAVRKNNCFLTFTGLGYQIAKWLAMMGATVIIGCRSEERAKEVLIYSFVSIAFLRKLDTFGRCFATGYKGYKFCDFLFAFLSERDPL